MRRKLELKEEASPSALHWVKEGVRGRDLRRLSGGSGSAKLRLHLPTLQQVEKTEGDARAQPRPLPAGTCHGLATRIRCSSQGLKLGPCHGPEPLLPGANAPSRVPRGLHLLGTKAGDWESGAGARGGKGFEAERGAQGRGMGCSGGSTPVPHPTRKSALTSGSSLPPSVLPRLETRTSWSAAAAPGRLAPAVRTHCVS